MCFSATASFTSGAVLIPVGMYCLRRAIKASPQSVLFAVYPLGFGIQQIFEGLLWLSLGRQLDCQYPAAFGFMFFSHFFWLWWVPLSVWWLEATGIRKNIALGLTITGAVYGALMYFPVLLNDGWLQIVLMNHSIVYEARLIYDGFMPRELVRAIYAVIVVSSLLTTSDRYVRYFGILILLSVVLAKLFFDYAFISIWCFYAALLSVYIVYMLHKQARGV